MKKLIALIGAVAMCFGAFADDPTPFSTSFETDDAGISTVDEKTIFTPGEGWENTTDEATFPVKAYEAGETLPYEAGTAMKRRDDSFTGGAVNNQYLKLSTGTNSLMRAVGEGNKFLDQLVKFTGFEEPQTNLVDGVKIAVWMSEYVVSEENDVEVTETNLYVTCAKVAVDGSVEQVALKIAPPAGTEYKLDTWYRLTIKTLDGIYTDAVSDSQRAGFIVYIDGEQIAAESDAAKNLIPEDFQSEMTDLARNFMAEKKLFPAISTTDAVFNKAGFEGMGGVDDIIIDNEGPLFAQTIEIAEDAFGLDPDMVEVDSVTVGGETIAKTDGKYIVKPGDTVVVNFKALDGYFINPKSKTFENVSKTTDFDVSEEIEVTEAAVMATINDTDVRYYLDLNDAYAELSVEIGHDDSVVIEILSQTALIDENENIVYELYQGAQVTIVPAGVEYPAGAYLVSIADHEEGEEEEVETIPGTATDNLGAMPGKTMIVEFTGEDELEGRAFNLQGNIYGYGEDETLIDVAGNTVLAGALTIGAACNGASTGNCGATLKTDTLDLDGNQITLEGKGKVMVKTTLTVADAFTNDADDIAVTEPAEVGGYYTYALKQGAAFTINPVEHTTITCEGATWDATLQKWVAPKAGDDVEVTVTADDGYLFSDGSAVKTETIQAADGETFTLNIAAPTEAAAKKGLKFFITLKDALDDDATEGAITLLADATLDNYTLTKAVVLNLDGFNLTGGEGTKQHKIFTLLDGADLTINGTDSTITGNFYLGVNNGVNAANLTLNGGEYQQADGVNEAVIQTNGGDTGAKVIAATGCTFSSTDDTFYLAGPATTTLTGCTVTGATGIYAKSGTITLVNTAVTGNGAKQEPVANGNGARSTGDAVIFDTITGYQGNMTLNVNGTSSLTSANGYAFQETVTRGTESGTLTVAIADTATVGAVKLSDQFAAKVAAGSASITGYVATVNGIAYKTAEAALLAVQAAEQAGATEIKVNAIDELSVTTEDEQSLTLAKGGTITITATGWAFTGAVSGKVVLAPGKQITIPLASKDTLKITTVEGYTLMPMATLETITYMSVVKPMIAKNLTTNVEYADLAEAISEAADGETIQLIADSEFEFDGEGVRVAGKAITLDLNGKKLSGKAYMPTAIKEQRMICVASDGDLTVLDSTVAEGGYGAGELHFEYINSGKPKYSAGYYLILNTGKFTLKSGKLTARDYADHAAYDEGDLVYAVENRSNGSSAELVIEGGYISVPDHNGQCAVRLYAYDSAEPKYVNKATITGGVLDNVYPFCMTIPHQGAKFDVNISGGTFNGYCRLKGDKYGYSRVNITGGIFNGNAEGFDIQEADAARENLPWLFISGGTFEQYEYLSANIGPTKDNTLIVGGTFNKVGKAEENPQNIEELLTPSIPVFAEKVAAADADHFSVAKVPAALEIVKATGVASVTYTVNDVAAGENQTVVYGDVVKITGITYAEGYGEGTVTEGEEFEMDAVVMAAAISGKTSVQIEVDAQLKTFTVTFADVENGTVETSVTNATMGTEVTIIATSAEGYAVDTIAVTNVDTEAEVTVTGDKFTMPAANVKVYATFKEASTEPIPPIDDPTQGDIEKVFDTAADQTLKTKVTPTNYSAFRDWSRSFDEDAAKSEGMVLATPDAFLCFALNSSTLPTGEITSDDVEIKAYNKDTGVIEVEIEGVTPGTNIPAGELAKVLSAVGGETLGGMTAEKVNVSGQCVEAGKIQVTVTPKDTTATTFFIKAELVK